MAIVPPEVRLSSTEKELLRLLGELVVEDSPSNGSNRPPDEAVLTDNEAFELLGLLEELSLSKVFLESAYFVEEITRTQVVEDNLREIYLSRRKTNGRSRAMASKHWNEFLVRLGFIRPKGRPFGWDPPPREMDVHHFLKMERVLLSQPGISAKVRRIVMRVVAQHAATVDASRRGDAPLPLGAISSLPNEVSSRLKESLASPVGPNSLTSGQVSGLMTVIVDTSVLFSTRDWGVAGTMSTIAGGFAAGTYK